MFREEEDVEDLGLPFKVEEPEDKKSEDMVFDGAVTLWRDINDKDMYGD